MASAIGTRKIPGARVCRGRDAKGGGRRSSLSLAQVQASGTMETVHLGYWRIRALGEPIRLICEVGQLPYEEHSYQVKWDDERGWHADEWFNEDKPKMKENNWPFANLPWLKHGNVRLCEVMAITHYLSTLCHLGAHTSLEQSQLTMLDSVARDVRNEFFYAVYVPNRGDAVLLNALEAKGRNLEKWLESQEGKYLMGSRMTYVDLTWFELIDTLNEYLPEKMAEFPTLLQFRQSVLNHPQVHAYRSSDRFSPRPFVNPFAKWGGS